MKIKHILLLFTMIFIISILFFSNSIFYSVFTSFSIEKNITKNEIFQKNSALYKKLQKKKENFNEIKQKIKNRGKNKEYIVNYLLNKVRVDEDKRVRYKNKINKVTLNYIDFKNKNVIINSETKREGDSIYGYTIFKIYENKILLYSKKGFIWLKLFK